ncbi:MAG: serine--tRNA ligase [Bacillus subtilis]|nr:serine--tRNA ligase [Bacillus subtilis]
MLDIKLIRENPDRIVELLNRRNGDFSYVYGIVEKDKTRREAIAQVELLKAKKNEVSKQIGLAKRQGLDIAPIQATVESIGEDIKRLDAQITLLDEEIKQLLLMTPNLPNELIAVGKDDAENRELWRYNEPRKFDFPIRAHYDLGETLDILDFARASEIAGARFVVYKGLGARLERSLIMFMMDLHANHHGYREIIPPYIVNEASMYATGQFPKFKEEAFKLYDDRQFYLNPTAEVPTINLHRDEVLDVKDAPICYVAYTTAFRQEAGSAGRDTRGILRQHQFNKVELIKFTKAEDSYQEHDKMLKNSEEVLEAIEVFPTASSNSAPAISASRCAKPTTSKFGFLPKTATAKSARSPNAEEYQARRADIKYRPTPDGKLEFVHTLNGSGLAVGRTVIAIMETTSRKTARSSFPKSCVPTWASTSSAKRKDRIRFGPFD